MKIINLIENTEGHPSCTAAHGLSFYIEAGTHRLLLDLGPSEETLSNAKNRGIDLTRVDTVILSHGHYDHSGGILPFAELNKTAVIYMQKSAAGAFYSSRLNEAGAVEYRYIGIDEKLPSLAQVRLVEGDLVIDETLRLFTLRDRPFPLPFTNRRLWIKTGDTYVPDDFRHEQFLVVTEGGKSVLLSGCAHNGILNILSAYRQRFGTDPDLCISGFHLQKKSAYTAEEAEEIRDTAKRLTGFSTQIYTCHCTGVAAFDMMKEILGDQLSYVHSGEEIACFSKEITRS